MEESSRRRVSRRRLLKTLAVTGGVAAASTMLPNKWAKPVVQVGVLPAHAQVSLTFLIACSGNGGGSAVDRVQQGTRIRGIVAECSPTPPAGTLIGVDVDADPEPLGGEDWYKEWPTSDDGVAYFPFFRVPRDAPIGTVLTFTFSFVDQDEFGEATCSFVMIVEEGGEVPNAPETEWGWAG
jgi:hypothetical protein